MAFRKRDSSLTEVKVVSYKDRPYGLRWTRSDGTNREVSSGCTRRKDAERAAAELELDLKSGDVDSPDISWPLFRRRYEAEHLSSLAPSTFGQWTTAANWFEKIIDPQLLSQVSKSTMSRFQSELKETGLADASVDSYVRTMQNAWGWAVEDVELMREAPRLRRSRKGKFVRKMRSRAINLEELERILMATDKVRRNDASEWKKFILGLWHSGLRVDELRRLSWDEDELLTVDTTRAIPVIRMLGPGHKNRNDCYQVITKDFWELIKLSKPKRSGYVFPFSCARKSPQISRKRLIRVISDIGSVSNVITEPTKGKTASSHDIGKRAFLTRMVADGHSLDDTRRMGRHSSEETTKAYYLYEDAQELAKKVGGW